jgi:glycosyltransferase involved in cell wall biosynthesis
MSQAVLPVSAIVPTRDRSEALSRMLRSLAQQSRQPAEMIVVDASTSGETEQICQKGIAGLETRIIFQRARTVGAAPQRNQAIEHCSQNANLLLDDDIIFEPECIVRLWDALRSDTGLGGVNAMIVNQHYSPPGIISRILFTVMHGRREHSFAGRVIGPAINLLPEDGEDLPQIVPVEWLNTTCTLYRREALPSPPFDSFFIGYSMMEDLALSLQVARRWRLANVRTARIFHDSQPRTHKDDIRAMAAMELVNRHYVMTEILGRKGIRDYLRLLLWEVFQLTISAARRQSRPHMAPICRGKFQGFAQVRERWSRRSARPQSHSLPSGDTDKINLTS